MNAARGSKSLERNVNLVNHAAALFYSFFVNQREREIVFNPKVSILAPLTMDLLAFWRCCDGNTLTSPLIFPVTCSAS